MLNLDADGMMIEIDGYYMVYCFAVNGHANGQCRNKQKEREVHAIAIVSDSFIYPSIK